MNASRTVVYWRDIPAQVIVRAGRRTARRALPARFQAAIDQAAMRAGLSGSDAYLGQWRRGAAPSSGAGEDRSADADGGDPEGQADALVRRLEAEFTAERLAAFAAAGGRIPAAEPSGSTAAAAQLPAASAAGRDRPSVRPPARSGGAKPRR